MKVLGVIKNETSSYENTLIYMLTGRCQTTRSAQAVDGPRAEVW